MNLEEDEAEEVSAPTLKWCSRILSAFLLSDDAVGPACPLQSCCLPTKQCDVLQPSKIASSKSNPTCDPCQPSEPLIFPVALSS